MVMDWKRVGNYDMMWIFREEREKRGWGNGGKNKAMACKNEMEMEMICSLCMYTLHNPRQ